MANAREREREALEMAHNVHHRTNDCAAHRAAIHAYGRAVREADKEAARTPAGSLRTPEFAGNYPPTLAYEDDRKDAAAIEALEEP